MRMSCNGCRVLRKGCSEDCSIRPCLQWIKNPESQANATVFLAKFYGRAGLMNLINAGPQNLRPAIFRSLLYEACGRIVNPIYGSVGLLWSGSWQLCQAAVEAVLKGEPITPITSEAAANGNTPPLKAYDIRHVSKDENSTNESQKPKTRIRSKRTESTLVKPKVRRTGFVPVPQEMNRTVSHESALSHLSEVAAMVRSKRTESTLVKPKVRRTGFVPVQQKMNRTVSHESALSHLSEVAAMVEGESKESESVVSVDTSNQFHEEPESVTVKAGDRTEEVGLELTLGFEPVSRGHHVVPVKKRKIELSFNF